MPCILLVEDDPDVRTVFHEILTDAGYEVDVAATFAGGIALLRRNAYDLLIADGRLPDGTGIGLGDSAADKGIPVLIVTGYAFGLRDGGPGANLGKYTLLRKPLRPEALLSAVARAIRPGPEAPGGTGEFDRA